MGEGELAVLIARDLPPGCRLEGSPGAWRLESGRSSIGIIGDVTQLRDVRAFVIESVVGGLWPLCPHHRTHPLDPAAAWRCSEDGTTWAYGSLADLPPSTPVEVPDDHVRWYAADEGWGFIAHRGGDLFVHFSQIAGTGYRSLRAGDHVTYRIGVGMQGLLRQAVDVRVIDR